jgi:hypothetical protein
MSLDSLRSIGNRGQWREEAVRVTAQSGKLSSSVEDFETYWIEAGHKIREQISNDQQLCVLLRAILPSYSGEDRVLYRGENRSRWNRGSIGLNWTTDENVARMFAGGLNAVDGGGVLLKATFPARKIIAAPSKHSVYLQEYQFTVEPPATHEVEFLEYFPQS